MRLSVLEAIPAELLSIEAKDLWRACEGPVLIHVQGRREPALFVSVLLHGNETTGWTATRRLVQKYRDTSPPRSLSLLIGNVRAARYGKRHLPEQPDYNRVWRGDGTPEHRCMREVLDGMRARGIFASIDVHNNTGRNPHYACVNRLEPAYLQLARLFSPTVIYALRPQGTLTIAFSELCPAVTIECGRPGEPHGIDHAYEYLDACLHLSEIPDHAVPASDLALFHTVCVVKVPETVRLGVGAGNHDLGLDADLDRLNFHELPVGTRFGKVREGLGMPVIVHDETGNEVTARYFALNDGALFTRRPVVPSMISLNTEIVRQDCLCYLMERYPT